MKLKRTLYAVQLKNGEFMRTDFYKNIETVKVFPTTDILLANLNDLYTTKKQITEIVFGETSLPVLYDDDNPPNRVVKVNIEYEIEEIGYKEYSGDYIVKKEGDSNFSRVGIILDSFQHPRTLKKMNTVLFEDGALHGYYDDEIEALCLQLVNKEE